MYYAYNKKYNKSYFLIQNPRDICRMLIAHFVYYCLQRKKRDTTSVKVRLGTKTFHKMNK